MYPTYSTVTREAAQAGGYVTKGDEDEYFVSVRFSDIVKARDFAREKDEWDVYLAEPIKDLEGPVTLSIYFHDEPVDEHIHDYGDYSDVQ